MICTMQNATNSMMDYMIATVTSGGRGMSKIGTWVIDTLEEEEKEEIREVVENWEKEN